MAYSPPTATRHRSCINVGSSPLWVQTGKAQCEHMFSALLLRADIAQQKSACPFRATTEPASDAAFEGRIVKVPLFIGTIRYERLPLGWSKRTSSARPFARARNRPAPGEP